MGSSSERPLPPPSAATPEPEPEPARPSAELLAALREGKEALRRRRIALPLREKVRQVLALQRLEYPLLIRRRAPRAWERPWDVEP